MGKEELTEEIDAIQAIFPNAVESLTSEIYNFTIPNHDDVTIQISFPLVYPDESPSIIQVITRDVRKFPDNNYLEEQAKKILSQLFNVGDVVIFELLGELEQFFEEYEQKHEKEIQRVAEQMEKLRIEEMKQKLLKILKNSRPPPVAQQESTPTINITASWIQSEPIVDRGSTFIAFAKKANSVEEAMDHFELLLTDRKVARSNHNMNAWRIKGENGVIFQDCDDDGETAAGLRMLHLLQVRFYYFFFLHGRLVVNFITNYLDYGCLERYCCGEQMVWWNAYRARSIQAHKLNNSRGHN